MLCNGNTKRFFSYKNYYTLCIKFFIHNLYICNTYVLRTYKNNNTYVLKTIYVRINSIFMFLYKRIKTFCDSIVCNYYPFVAVVWSIHSFLVVF